MNALKIEIEKQKLYKYKMKKDSYLKRISKTKMLPLNIKLK